MSQCCARLNLHSTFPTHDKKENLEDIRRFVFFNLRHRELTSGKIVCVHVRMTPHSPFLKIKVPGEHLLCVHIIGTAPEDKIPLI